jgi:hypothetical protein
MISQHVRLIDERRQVVATAQVVEQDGTFAGAIDLSSMPTPLRQLFEEYEEIVHTHMFSLLDEIEEKIEALHLKVVFEDDHEAALTDVQIYPNTKKVSFQVVKGDETIVPLQRESIVGAYFAQLNKALESDKDAKQIALLFAHRLGSEYFLAILQTMSETDRLCREMESILNEFTGRDLHGTPFTGKLLTIEHLAIAMKLYVISWSTLRDLLASLVNAVFNLGIADRDVALHRVLRNADVQSSRIPQILQAYDNTLLIKDLQKKRNDVVHRGRIPDEDIERILTERNRIDSRRYSLLEQNPTSEEEHKRQISLLQQELRTLAQEKQDLWRKHHQQTIAMISEIAGELVLKTIDLYKEQAI